VPSVADEQNYDPLITARMAAGRGGLDALKWRLYVAVTAHAERRNLRAVRGISACSEEDAAIFRREAPHAEVVVVPNAVDAAAFAVTPPGDDVVMTGSFAYSPNREGAERMARRIWPLVRAAVPSATLRFVGLRGEEVLRGLAGLPGVTVVGTVPEIQPELARARVAVAPLDVGGGTRLKILEAMAAARPVVSTTIGAEGLAVRDGAQVFLRDDDAAFADAVIRLLREPALALTMGLRGRTLVEEHYDWEASADALDALVRRVAA
jgi:glycosyltransferase involved in cell wall biosynthesis